MHPRLTEIVAYLDEQRSAVLDAANVLPREQWTTRPAPDRWAVSEICEHLYRVERGIAPLVAQRAAEAREAGHPAETEFASLLGSLDDSGVLDRSVKRSAPERVTPTECPDAANALTRLATSRGALRAAIASADGLALGTVRAMHPRLGELDLYQWILFIGLHERRHLGQVEETAASVASAALH